jgi:hypothetical protein
MTVHVGALVALLAVVAVSRLSTGSAQAVKVPLSPLPPNTSGFEVSPSGAAAALDTGPALDDIIPLEMPSLRSSRGQVLLTTPKIRVVIKGRQLEVPLAIYAGESVVEAIEQFCKNLEALQALPLQGWC